MVDIKRRAVLTASGVVLVGTLAGCSGADNGNGNGSGNGDTEPEPTETETPEETPEPEEEATVRVAHLSPDAPNVDVYVDGDAILEDVPFRAVSEYLDLPAGSYEVTITAAGDPDTVAFEDTLDVPEGDFTVAAIGELSEENQPFSLLVLEDDLSDPGDEARVRVVHASPDAPAVDVTIEETADVLVEDAAFGDAATVTVPEGEYTLEVRPATEDNDGDVVATFDVAVAEGSVYTAFAVGYLDPDSAPADEAFDLEITLDAGSGGEPAEDADASLRAAHMSPDAPNVDVYVDGDAVLEDVPFRAVSDYLSLESGEYEVKITAAGDTDTVVFDSDVPLESGMAYTAAAIGELSEENQPFEVALLEDDLSDPGEMARVRVVHASPDAPAVDVTVEETGDVLVEDAAFGDVATVEVPEGAYTLEIRPATEDNDGDVVATFDVELSAGWVYTAFAAGYLEPEDAPADEAFDLEIAVDLEPDNE